MSPAAPRSAVTVVGLGLIGGSLALRLARDHDVTGWDAAGATRAAAVAAGLTVADDLPASVGRADVVVLAVPLPALPATVVEVGPLLAPRAVLTDVGSVKRTVYDAARAAGLGGRFVGGHPMAGREVAGFGAADPDLFDGAAWVLTLEPDTDLAHWLALADLVSGLGARVVPTTVADHDAAVARISHLPHLLAAALAAVAGAAGPLPLALAAGSFRDGTRVAATPPELPVAMCTDNAVALAPALAEVRDLLAGDAAELLRAGHAVRSGWPSPAVDAAPLARADPDLRGRLLALGRAGGWLSQVAGDVLSVQRPA